MTKYKVIYFETTGVVEVIRLILSHAGESFEDVRVPLTEWEDLKRSIPFERLPVIEIDEKQYHQSLAIARYLAKRYDLAGKNDEENLEIDAIVDTINDFRVYFTECLWEVNPAVKAVKKEVILREKIPFFIGKFGKLVKNNGGYLWGNKLTWADLTFLGILPYLNVAVGLNILDDYPDIQEYVDNISDIPNIRQWLNKRPERCCIKELVESGASTINNKENLRND